MNKNLRKHKIYSNHRYRANDVITVPQIKLEGKWLDELGFKEGSAIAIHRQPYKLTITVIKEDQHQKKKTKNLPLRHIFRNLYNFNKPMSQAFVKESDEQWLHEVAPTINALIVYLTRENNGIRVYEKNTYVDRKTNREVHVMSNGLSYAKDDQGQWYVV